MKHLDDIGARIRDCSIYNFGMRNADRLAHEDAPKMADALRAVLELHKPRQVPAMSFSRMIRGDQQCAGCFRDYPCATVHAITEALQGEQ